MLLANNNRLYLAAAVLVAAGLLALAWVALARAQEQEPGTEKMAGASAGPGAAMPFSGPSGIWVTGNGEASGSPDIAVVSLGVESLEETAAASRVNAANAMRRVMSALTRAGVSNSDIQTRYFDISPRYQSVEVERCDTGSGESGSQEEAEEGGEEVCYKVWENRLIGYSVSNQASVKIRNLNRAGAIIDAVAAVAGDMVRINGVSFDIENPQPLHDKARAGAVEDMKRKARMLAELSGVELGALVYLSEGVVNAPPQPLYARAESAFAATSSDATVISGGELEYKATVQGVFLIIDDAESN